jgi:hypothetical protein
MQRNGVSAVSAIQSDWLAQDKVKKESEQVRKQGCNQYPRNRPHSTPPSVGKHKPETQKPDSDKGADH